MVTSNKLSRCRSRMRFETTIITKQNEENSSKVVVKNRIIGGGGAFLVMSYPHFLFADNVYRNSVVGMWPDEDKHKIFVDIEPMFIKNQIVN
ncbi:unnamed protein product [Spodoptera littoralis]|uniref:Uncharacterized protein n=1 Tax=Spodoptera littoralis TaxID=7109 RepID=A0A9P0N7D3_SPOLI|nr:unnamed protein product [Spodoptera littoralis]CAH1647830.1 unnamed protein product [Spodoptera littoralis]